MPKTQTLLKLVGRTIYEFFLMLAILGLIIAVSALCGVVCASGVLWDLIPDFTPKPQLTTLELYPNAQYITYNYDPHTFKSTDSYYDLEAVFLVDDSPENILDYYKDFATNDHWPGVEIRDNSVKADLYFHWEYYFNVTVEPGRDGMQKVTVRIWRLPVPG